MPGHLHPARAAFLTSRGFFPTLISPAFAQGLLAAFGFAAVACLIAALASLLRAGGTSTANRPALPDRPARAPRPTRPRPHPAADNRGIHPDRSMTAHPAGAETRSRVLQSGGITIKMVIRGTSAGFADAW